MRSQSKLHRAKINAVLGDFRRVVVQIQEEHDFLTARAKDKQVQIQIGESVSTTSTNLTSTTTTASPVHSPPPEPVRPPRKNSHKVTIQPKSNIRSIIEKFADLKLLKGRNHQPSKENALPKVKENVMAAKRGALIVLEGLDRVGKTTLANKLVNHLTRSDHPVAHYRFPDRNTPIGQLISELLKDPTKHIDDHAMHLLFSANRWELNKQIRQTILSGTNVIVDRYSYSGIAYSCAKRDLDMTWCSEVEKGLPKPDLVIYLDLSKETQYSRQGFGDERFEVKEFQEIIRKQYKRLIDSSKEVWLCIDVENKGPEQVLGEVILPVARCIDACSDKPLKDLD